MLLKGLQIKDIQETASSASTKHNIAEILQMVALSINQ